MGTVQRELECEDDEKFRPDMLYEQSCDYNLKAFSMICFRAKQQNIFCFHIRKRKAFNW